jgi:hypothetical protein
VGVLTAVFSKPGTITFNIAGARSGVFKGRIEQLDEMVFAGI